MKVMLIFPPQAQPFMAHIAAPQLKAVLEKEDIEVLQRDFNLEAYEDIFEISGINGKDINCLTEVKNYLRNGHDYFIPHKYYESIDFLEKHLEHISHISNGFRWSLKNYVYYSYIPACSEHIFKALRDDRANIFLSFFKKKLKDIEKEDPSVLGISVSWQSQLIPAFTLACLVKESLPHIHICMGGSMITHLADYLQNKHSMFQCVDSYMPFEGETGLVCLAKEFKDKNFEKVPGLIYIKNKEIVANSSQIWSDLDTIPFADFDDLPLDKYYSPQVYLPIAASRGCYWSKCAFCSHHFSGSLFRKKSALYVFDEMNYYYERYKCKNFYFVDDALPPDVIFKISSMIIEERKPYRWAGEMRFEKTMDSDFFNTLYKGGCRLLLFGLESYSQTVLDLMNKGFQKEIVLPVLRSANSAGIITWLFFFLGFPGEEKAQAMETLDFIINNRYCIDMTGCGPFILTKNSPVYFNPQKFPLKKIYDYKKQDLQTDYPFIPSSGLQRYEVDRILQDFWNLPETEKFLKPFVAEPHLLFFKKSDLQGQV